MKSLLMVLSIYPGCGGIERITSRQARYLADRNVRVTIVSLRGQATPGAGSEDELEREGVRCVRLPEEGRADTVRNRRFLKALIAQCGAEMVLQQGVSPGLVKLCGWVCRVCGVPLVTAHHSSPESLTYFLDSERTEAVGWNWRGAKTLVKRLTWSWLYRPRGVWKIRRMIRRIYWQSGRVLLLSARFIPAFAELGGLKETDKLVGVPNALIFDGIPGGGEMDGKKKEVLFMGRLVGIKRIDRILRIWARVEAAHPDWRLRLVGDGPLRPELERLAEELGLRNVVFEGEAGDPRRYYRSGAILLLTSDQEGFGMVIPEAMLFGAVPVVYASYAAAYDLIRDGEDGFLVAPFDEDYFTECLSLLMEDHGRRREMGAVAAVSARRFEPEVVFGRWYELLDGML